MNNIYKLNETNSIQALKNNQEKLEKKLLSNLDSTSLDIYLELAQVNKQVNGLENQMEINHFLSSLVKNENEKFSNISQLAIKRIKNLDYDISREMEAIDQIMDNTIWGASMLEVKKIVERIIKIYDLREQIIIENKNK